MRRVQWPDTLDPDSVTIHGDLQSGSAVGSQLRLGTREQRQQMASGRTGDANASVQGSNSDELAKMAALGMGPLKDPLVDPLTAAANSLRTTRSATSVTAGNDNFGFGIKQPDEHLVGVGKFGDDDGKTSELTARHARETTYASGDSDLLTFGLRHDTLTEDGNWQGDDRYNRHEGKRTDVAEIGAQLSKTRQKSARVKDTVGLGGGIQAIGNLGGYAAQDKVHEIKGSGGRGDRLQQQYTSDGVDSVLPYVSGGAARELDLGLGVSAYGGARGKLALGDGYSYGEGFAGVRGRHKDPLNGALGVASPSHIDWNASATAGYAAGSDAMNFNNDYDKGYLGAQAGAGIGFGPLSVNAGVRTGGLTGEALVGHVGVGIGGNLDDLLDTFK